MGHQLPKPAFQNRGKRVCSVTSAQYGGKEGKGIDFWFSCRHRPLWEALGYRYMLFGEWCYHVHSVAYDRLPDHFVGFDVFDRKEGRYLSVARRDAMLAPLGVRTVCACAVLHPARGHVRSRMLAPHALLPRLTQECARRCLPSPAAHQGTSKATAPCSMALTGGMPRCAHSATAVPHRWRGSICAWRQPPAACARPQLCCFIMRGCVAQEGDFLKYRAKIVRHDFIQAIEDEGRWEHKQTVLQKVDDSDYAYFYCTLCNGSTQTVMGPAELDT